MADKELVHSAALVGNIRQRIMPCEARRVRGILVTGDPDKITCPGCKSGKSVKTKNKEE